MHRRHEHGAVPAVAVQELVPGVELGLRGVDDYRCSSSLGEGFSEARRESSGRTRYGREDDENRRGVLQELSCWFGYFRGSFSLFLYEELDHMCRQQ